MPSKLTKEQKLRLDKIGSLMKTAKGKRLEALLAEVDKIIGFDPGDDQYDAERDASWTRSQKE